MGRDDKQGGISSGKVLELSEEAYYQLANLAEPQQQTLEDMLRLCLEAYEEAHYGGPSADARGRGARVAARTAPAPWGDRRR